MKTDLHIHTIFSDGVYTPEKLLKIASNRNFDLISFTDHDTVDGYLYAMKIIDRYSVNILPGVEISCSYDGNEIHILAYNFDPNSQSLLKVINFNQLERESRIRRFIKKFEEYNIFLTYKDVIEHASHIIGRPHIAAALIKKGYAKNYFEAFEKYLIEKSPTFVEKRVLGPTQIIKAIKNSGGVSVIAHPYRILQEKNVFDLIEMGIDGIEAYYINHSKKNIQKYVTLAKKHNLIVTGGSDFHWQSKNKKFGDYSFDEYKPFSI